jgi:hypothetical protein
LEESSSTAQSFFDGRATPLMVVFFLNAHWI